MSAEQVHDIDLPTRPPSDIRSEVITRSALATARQPDALRGCVMDWTPIAVGAMTATAVVAGGVATTWTQARLADRRTQQEATEVRRVERRDAYLALLIEIERVRAASDGAAVSGLPVPSSDYAPEFTRARVRAEFFAPRATWESMEPLVQVASIRLNAVSNVGRGSELRRLATERLHELDGYSPEGWERLWRKYVHAALEDLRQ